MKDLVERRVPQYLAIYLGVAWGVVQFISFLEDRYPWLISQHLTDIALLTFGLLIPSVALFVYNHGRPGKDQWTRTEKVGIPLNLVIAAAVLFLIFGNKDLGAVMTSVTTRDETGKEVERVVPNASYRKRLALFNFDAPAQDTSLAWLRYALPLGISTDLSQDMFIDVRTSAYFREKLRQLGFKDEVNVPFTLKRQIAEEQHLLHFTNVRLSRTGDQISADVALHETATGKLVERKTYQNSDVFSLIDQISAGLKESLEIPETDKVRDLPISEVLTSSLAAFRSCMDGFVALQINDQWQQAAQHLEIAVQIDSTFAYAWLTLHNLYLFTNQGSKAMPPLQKAMDNSYRLPERMQYDLKAEHYAMRERNIEKALAVVKMRVDLFPEDIAGYLLLSQLQAVVNDRDGMIASYQKILELDPAQHERLRELGLLYEAKGDFENALRSFTRYAELFPSKPEALVSIGSLLRLQGKHDQARANYEKALLIAPENVGAIVRMGNLERDLGNFEQAQRQYNHALETAKTTEARAEALDGMADYYEFRGQYGQAVRTTEQFLQESAKVEPPLLNVVKRMSLLGRYVHAGQADRAQAELKRVAGQLQPPYDGFASLGELKLALELEQPDAAQTAVGGVEQVIKSLGYKMLNGVVLEANGEIAEMRGQCRAAIEHFEAKQKLEPIDPSIHVQIGRCYRKLGQPKKAIEHLEQAIAIVPFQAHANYEIGLAWLADGNSRKAQEHLRRAASVWSNADPSYTDAAEAKAKLKEVSGS